MLCRTGPCKYHGWLLLEEWCRHPDHLEPLKPGHSCAMMAAGGRCAGFLDFEAKLMPGAEPPWPLPVAMRQLVAVIAVCLPIGYKNEETSAKNDTKRIESSKERARPESVRPSQAVADVPFRLC